MNKDSLVKSLKYGFYDIKGYHKTGYFRDAVEAAHDAVSTFSIHRYQNLRLYLTYGGPAHQAPPRITNPIYEKTGIFILATAACEIANYEGVWADVYNSVAASKFYLHPTTGTLVNLIRYWSELSCPDPHALLDDFLGENPTKDHWDLPELIKKAREERQSAYAQRA